MSNKASRTATKTFLFTDLVRSTTLWEAQPEVMKSALADHFDRITEAIVEAGGHVFNHTGDGLVAVFDEPAAALVGAAEAQRRIAVADATPLGRLGSRMGIHTGPCYVYPDRYSGQALNRCARLMAIGHGGQILVSGDAASLVAGCLPQDFELHLLGEYWLRDITEAERVHQLAAPGLASDFDVVRSRRTSIDRLPAQSGSFIGRDTELGLIKRLIRKERRPVVTIIGQGGIGKTSLARRAAEELWADFRDGVYWVDVAGLPVDALATSIASDLGIPLAPTDRPSSRAPWTRISEALSSNELLLVLDSCEAHLATVAQFAGLLASGAPAVSILLTSRQPLALAVETELVLTPLSAGSSDDFETSPAVDLFVTRARSVRPDMTFGREPLERIQRIVTALDGLPLAIEQAAASLNVLTLAEVEIVSSKADRLDQLPGFDRLRSSFEQSMRLLSATERELLVELPVFVGGFSAEAASAVCLASDGGSDVRFTLSQLVNKSLLYVSHSYGVSAFRMLEATRACSLYKVSVSSQSQDRHLKYFQELALSEGARYRSGDQQPSIAVLSAAWPDIRGAVTRTIAEGDFELASELVLALHEFCLFSERTEIYQWAAALTPHLEDGELRASILGVDSLGAWIRGDMQLAIEIAEKALALCPSGEPAMFANRTMMNSLSYLGRIDEATPNFIGVLQACQVHDEKFWQIDGKASLSMGMTLMGDSKSGEGVAREAVAEAARLGSQVCLSWAFHALGLSLAERDPVMARSAILRAIDEAVSVDASWNYNNCQIELLLLNRHLDEFNIAGAQTAWGLLGRLARAGNMSQIWQVVLETAYMLASCGRFEEAAALHQAVIRKPRMPRPREHELDRQIEDVINAGLAGKPVTELPESFLSDQEIVRLAREGIAALLAT